MRNNLKQYSPFIIVAIVLLTAIIFSSNTTSTTAQDASDGDSETVVDPETGFFVTNGLIHSVPLDSIIFDTFSGVNRALPYSQASERVIENLRDQITPLCEEATDLIPRCIAREYEDVAAANEWMDDSFIVMGYVDANGQAYAYPFNILNFHEIVNDTLAGQPILVSYCPLCNSAVVYSRELDGEALLFGNTSALYENDLVMYDQSTDSYWYQVGGEAILGPRTGSRLTPLPSTVTTWEQWRSANPDTLVLARPLRGLDYRRNPFVGYQEIVNSGRFAFGVSDEVRNDNRLPAGSNVLMVAIEEDVIAYPLELIGDAAVTDEVGGEEIVILSRAAGPSGAAYRTTLADGSTVDLVFDAEANGWRDQNTNSLFDLNGNAVEGELEGTSLTPVPSRFTMWFAAVATNPEVVVYDGS